MTSEQELVSLIEECGGRFSVESDKLIIEPARAGLPFLDALRMYKSKIMALIQNRAVDEDELGQWLKDRCCFDKRCAAGAVSLYRDFERWREAQALPDAVSQQAFMDALTAAGCAMTPEGLWYGLILREDFAAFLGPYEYSDYSNEWEINDEMETDD